MDSDALTLGELNQYLFFAGIVVLVLVAVAVSLLAVSLWQEHQFKKAIRRQK